MFLLLPLLAGCGRTKSDRVVLYCSQDREFALGVLEEFQKQTGIEVVPKFDTEANKSVGLFREIVAEKDKPRCDLFWNNEILGTIRLHQRGLLAESDDAAAMSYPEYAKAGDRTWFAFAARARVLIINNANLKSDSAPKTMRELSNPLWKNRLVMAKPMFGTTATQAACLSEVWGLEKAKEFYQRLKDNQVHLAPGNKQVAEWVGRGRTAKGEPVTVGLTDSDDALGELKKQSDVSVIFPDAAGESGSRMGTLFIPNTLMRIKNSPNPSGAQKLLDYLLSAEVETQLASGPSGQIPLNPEVKAKLPAWIEEGRKAKAMGVDWAKAAKEWEEIQRFLASFFA
jgi:iron(III) transport system substrate-binding protein